MLAFPTVGPSNDLGTQTWPRYGQDGPPDQNWSFYVKKNSIFLFRAWKLEAFNFIHKLHMYEGRLLDKFNVISRKKFITCFSKEGIEYNPCPKYEKFSAHSTPTASKVQRHTHTHTLRKHYLYHVHGRE